jgi:hypothetical protein
MVRDCLYRLPRLQDQFVPSRVVLLNLLVDAGGFGDGVHLSFPCHGESTCTTSGGEDKRTERASRSH